MSSIPQELKFNDAAMETAKRIISRYPEGKQKSALIPILHLAQGEFDGWLSVPVMDYVASILKIAPIEVYEVASFYSMFNLSPTGKHVLEVCHTSSCWLRGAEDIVKHLENKLGIKSGETTADGKFTIKRVECLGSCGTAPMLQLGAQFHENLNPEKVDAIIDSCNASQKRSTYFDPVDLVKYK
jgi:NADH-quinone oxidoreductase subunit E